MVARITKRTSALGALRTPWPCVHRALANALRAFCACWQGLLAAMRRAAAKISQSGIGE